MNLMSLICSIALLGLSATTKGDEEKPVATKEKCECKAIEVSASGWCNACDNGAFMETQTKSLRIYQLLAGTKVPADLDKVKCEGCREAISASKKDKIGHCEPCKKTVKNGRVYGSKYALALASDVLHGKLDTSCEACQKDLAAKKGFCDDCKVGVIGKHVFQGKKSYESALAAQEIALAAMAMTKKCEECAIAILKDGMCEDCGTEFKVGKLVTKSN